jgi:hypothetical protein
MGLDMYLSARKYIGNYDGSAAEEKRSYAEVLKAAGVRGLTVAPWAPHLSVEVCVAYWRKANAIHKCEKTLKGRGTARGVRTAKESLPTASGCFFGETDFGSDYWYSLGDTAAQIREVLGNKSLEGFDFSYKSSW